MTILSAPSETLLDDLAETNSGSLDGQLLHDVVRRGLIDLIGRHFVDGQKFWPEHVLCERLNVSRVTVRRALSELSEDGTLQRHRAKGTFVQKSVGRRMVSVRHTATALKTVGIFVPNGNSSFWSQVLNALGAMGKASGFQVHVYSIYPGETSPAAIGQLATEPSSEGILLLGNSHDLTRDLYSSLSDRGYRVVAIDIAVRETPAPFVGVNNDMGIRIGMQHLFDLGHERITMMVYEPTHILTTQLRVNAFKSIVAERQLQHCDIVYADLGSGLEAYKTISNMLDEIWAASADKPSAIFCDSGAGQVAALKWCAERHVVVPKDLSIIGFDDSPKHQYSRPPATVVAQPIEAIIGKAVEMLRNKEMGHVLLPPSLIVRGSTAAPMPNN